MRVSCRDYWEKTHRHTWLDHLAILVMFARTAGVRATTGTPAAAGHGLAFAVAAPAKGGKERQASAGVHIATCGASDGLVGLAHRTPFLKFGFTTCTVIFVYRHLILLRRTWFLDQRSIWTYFTTLGLSSQKVQDSLALKYQPGIAKPAESRSVDDVDSAFRTHLSISLWFQLLAVAVPNLLTRQTRSIGSLVHAWPAQARFRGSTENLFRGMHLRWL